MIDITHLALLTRTQLATGADRNLDATIHQKVYGLHTAPVRAPRYTQSLDDAIALLQKCLPGWWWTCGDCQLTHDASVAIPGSNGIGLASAIHATVGPDFRASDEMQALLQKRPDLDGGVSVDRVGGNVALAIVECVFEALVSLSEQAKAA